MPAGANINDRRVVVFGQTAHMIEGAICFNCPLKAEQMFPTLEAVAHRSRDGAAQCGVDIDN
ncbi:MAG: hypothetical protein RL186_449 [Pseudomonadota bacterium]